MNQKGSMSRFLAERLDFGFWAVILFLVNSCAAADYRYEACAPRMCGNLSISYPFYIKGQEEPYCRSNFPEFEVNCINSETPLIYKPENYFVLDTISYKTNTYRMHVHGVANTTDCLPQFSNSTYVSYYETVEALHFLSNCTAQLPEVLLKYKRNQCGGNVSGGWDLVMLWDDKNLEMAKEECITNLVMPVETTPGEENGVVDYLALLKKGVQENWTANDCIGCMESGGRCGFNQSTYLFQCFCPDRPHRVKCQPPLPSWSEEHRREANVTCPSDFQCGSTSLMFPFIDLGHYNCGLCMMDCSSKPFPKIALEYPPGQWLIAKYLGNPNMTLYSELLASLLKNQSCLTFFYQLTLPNSPSISFTTVNTITLFRCKKAQLSFQTLNESFPGFGYYGGCNHDIFYSKDPNLGLPGNRSLGPNCSAIHLPYDKLFPQDNRLDVVDEVFRLLSPEYDLQWHVSEGCNECRSRGGICETDWSKKRHCTIGDGNRLGTGKKRLATILGSVGAALVAVAVVLAIFLICRRKKGIKGPYFLSRNYSKQSSKLDFEEGSVYLGVSLFTYTELREATKNFDASKELGDGGFGTVYYGKLQDGREVAVKRLYEHNFKRLEQFMNEIEILTRLRHPNLVALYGCTSRRSRELLLVYEYIPNGTIADHLHGDRADHKYLTWTHRMSIAIETAEALSYLHASDIIHRDVKTTNILLDHNFCVKVADFGLSRLFPLDVTHVSTAPQGTPGYVDPEYHQCYHLTDKSDVYSFGVVLVELISSMPAVDMSRHRHEINLANLAINRIQRCAFDELIDPSLGYKTDAEVMRMTTSVAELAFQCLQGEKEMRPSMGEVLQTLKDIQSFKQTSVQTVQSIEEVKDNVNVFSPESEDRVLLKNAKFPSSPVSVTHLWVSSSTSASTNSN